MLILDFDRLCRLCLTTGENLVPIFENDPPLNNRIENYTCLKLSSNDGLPTTLCMDCLSKINLIMDFQDLCKRSDTVLREYIQAKEAAIEQENVTLNDRNGAEPELQEVGNKSKKKGRGKGKATSRKMKTAEQVCGLSTDNDVDCGQTAQDASKSSTEFTSLESDLISTEKSEDVSKNGQLYPISEKEKARIRTAGKGSLSSNDHILSNESDDLSDDTEYAWPGSLSDEEFDQSPLADGTDKDELSMQKSSSHPRKKRANSYECEYCGRTFPRSNHLAQHELTHTKEKPFLCSYCQKGFWYKNSLIGHIKQNHTGEVNYTCDECGRGFFQKSEFMRHKPIHSNETPFKCDECDMSFKLMKNLKRHQKVHTGIRTHTCQYCGKSFRMLQTLRVHLVLHSGEKPYKCTHCGRGFSQSAPLKAHIRMHTGEKPYVCNVCNKAFPTGNSLKAHMFKHTGIHPNSCNDCSLRFKRKRDLVAHWNSVHGGAATDPVKVPPQLPPQGPQSCPSESVPNLLDQQSLHLDPLVSPTPSEPSLPVPTPSIQLQQPSQFNDMLIIGSMDPLTDEESLSGGPQSHHEILLNPLPSVLEMSPQPLMSPSLIKSDSDDLLSADDLSFT